VRRKCYQKDVVGGEAWGGVWVDGGGGGGGGGGKARVAILWTGFSRVVIKFPTQDNPLFF